MRKLNVSLALAVISTAAFVSACGSNSDPVAVIDPSTQTGQSVQKTLDFIMGLIANNDENSDPIDINAITLAVDDAAEPSAL